MVNMIKEPFDVNIHYIPTLPAVVRTLLKCIVLVPAGSIAERTGMKRRLDYLFKFCPYYILCYPVYHCWYS